MAGAGLPPQYAMKSSDMLFAGQPDLKDGDDVDVGEERAEDDDVSDVLIVVVVDAGDADVDVVDFDPECCCCDLWLLCLPLFEFAVVPFDSWLLLLITAALSTDDGAPFCC